jgi:hypothetical protein
VTTISVEDLEDAGFYRLGHQKRLLLAIRRVRDLQSAGGPAASSNSCRSRPGPPFYAQDLPPGSLAGPAGGQLSYPGKPPAPPQVMANRPGGGLYNSFQMVGGPQQQQLPQGHLQLSQHLGPAEQQQQHPQLAYHPDILRIQQHHHQPGGGGGGGSPCGSPLPSRATSSFNPGGNSSSSAISGGQMALHVSDEQLPTGVPEPMPPLQYPFFHHQNINVTFQQPYSQQPQLPPGVYPGSPRLTPRAAGGLGTPSPSPWRMLRSYDDADILRHADHSVLIHEAPRPPPGAGGRPTTPGRSGTLPRPKVRHRKKTLYVFDSVPGL